MSQAMWNQQGAVGSPDLMADLGGFGLSGLLGDVTMPAPAASASDNEWYDFRSKLQKAMERIIDARLVAGEALPAETVRRFSRMADKTEACGWLWRRRRLSALAREAVAIMAEAAEPTP